MSKTGIQCIVKYDPVRAKSIGIGNQFKYYAKLIKNDVIIAVGAFKTFEDAIEWCMQGEKLNS